MKKESASGVWSLDVRGAKPGDEYMFLINGELERKDPRARMVTASDGKCVIYDTAAFEWGQSKRPTPVSIGELVVYQLHPGTFHDPNPDDGEPGTLRDAMGKLDHLVQMGVNCVLLLPVNEFAGRHSWGYNPSDLFAVESAYGGPGDLDLWQFDGHGGGENAPGIYFYEDNERGQTPWGPRPDFGRREVVAFVEDEVRMWFDECRIDGLRWDSTINIRAINDGTTPYLEGDRMLDRLVRMIRTEYPDRFSIADDSVGDRRFDASWE